VFADAVDFSTAVDISSAKIALVAKSKVFVDPLHELVEDDLLKYPLSDKELSHKNVASFGFSQHTHWFLVTLHNSQSTQINRLLVFEPSWLDEIEVILVAADGNKQRHIGGDNIRFENRSLQHQNINFELTIAPGINQLLVRTRTVDPYHVAMTLWEQKAFLKSNNTEMLYLGILYGAVIAMLLYNLMLFISVREKVYAAYITYLFFFLLMHAAYNGYLYPLLWPNSPVLDSWAHSIFIYLFVGSGLFFAISFLELRVKQIQAYRWSLGLGLLMLVSFCLTAFGGYALHVNSSIIWVLIYAPFVLCLGLLSLIAGNRAARFFLSAAVAGFIGSFITGLAVMGIIEYTYLTYHAVDIGMLIDAILLSFALADRLRLARAQAEEAKAQLLQTTNKYAQQLEKTVALRTIELSKANAAKDKFFSIIAHDLRGPIGSLASLFNNVITRADEFTEVELNLARTATTNTKNFLEQLLTWARSQQGNVETNISAINIKDTLIEMQSLFAIQARSKNIKLRLTDVEACWVFADPDMLVTILRNLINNALKFSNSGGTVTASLTTEKDHCLIKIIDTGVGINDKDKLNLFRLDKKSYSTSGTNEETGSGLGLILCAEFVERNNGTIGVDSVAGEGSIFWFTLPKVAQNTSEQRPERDIVQR